MVCLSVSFDDVVYEWLLSDWKTFQIVSSVPLFLQLLLYFILPESPRWLIAVGRYKEAKDVVKKAEKMNKVLLQLWAFQFFWCNRFINSFRNFIMLTSSQRLNDEVVQKCGPKF